MYRVSREGRRASLSGQDPENRPTRYKERFDNNNVSSSYRDTDKGKNFPAAMGAGALPANPRLALCLKIAAGVMGLFFVRGVHRSMCPAGSAMMPTETQVAAREELLSRITVLDQKLEQERQARKAAEDAMEDLRAKDRGRAGLPGAGGSDGPQLGGAEAEAGLVGFREEHNYNELEPLGRIAGEDPPNEGITKSDVQNLLKEKTEDLEERIQEVKDLQTKNKALQAKVADLESLVETRRHLAREGAGVSQQPGAENGSNPALGELSTGKHRFGRNRDSPPQQWDSDIDRNDGFANGKRNEDAEPLAGGNANRAGKREFYHNPNDKYEGHQSNEPGAPFESMGGWVMEDGSSSGGTQAGDSQEGAEADAVATNGGDNHEDRAFDGEGTLVGGAPRVGERVGDGSQGGSGFVKEIQNALEGELDLDWNVKEGVDWEDVRARAEDGDRVIITWEDEEESAAADADASADAEGEAGGRLISTSDKEEESADADANADGGRPGGGGGGGGLTEMAPGKESNRYGLGRNQDSRRKGREGKTKKEFLHGVKKSEEHDPTITAPEQGRVDAGVVRDDSRDHEGENRWERVDGADLGPNAPALKGFGDQSPEDPGNETSSAAARLSQEEDGNQDENEDEKRRDTADAADSGGGGGAADGKLPAPSKISVERMERKRVQRSDADIAEREDFLRQAASENSAKGPLASLVEKAEAQAVEALEAAGLLGVKQREAPETHQGVEQRAVEQGEKERATGEGAGKAVDEAISKRAAGEESKKDLEGEAVNEGGPAESKDKASEDRKAEEELVRKGEAGKQARREAEREEDAEYEARVKDAEQRLNREAAEKKRAEMEEAERQARREEAEREEAQRQARREEAEREEAQRQARREEAEREGEARKEARRKTEEEEAERQARSKEADRGKKGASEQDNDIDIEMALEEMVMGKSRGKGPQAKQQPAAAHQRDRQQRSRGDDDDDDDGGGVQRSFVVPDRGNRGRGNGRGRSSSERGGGRMRSSTGDDDDDDDSSTGPPTSSTSTGKRPQGVAISSEEMSKRDQEALKFIGRRQPQRVA